MPTKPKPFEAKYPGRCPACGSDITPGDQVVYDGPELVHEDCAPAREYPSTVDQVVAHLFGPGAPELRL